MNVVLLLSPSMASSTPGVSRPHFSLINPEYSGGHGQSPLFKKSKQEKKAVIGSWLSCVLAMSLGQVTYVLCSSVFSCVYGR